MRMFLIDLLKKLNGKTFTVLACIFGLLFVFYFFGCEPKTCSILEPDREVTANELNAEISMFEARVQDRMTDLERKKKLRQFLIDQASIISTTGTVNPIGVLNSLATIFSIGVAVDARRKLANANKKSTD
jgi:hypothetical protein